jgi:glycerol-3-phosphate dehydrogenase
MFDVCIIGAGGVVGCAMARELAQRGLAVAGIEKHDTVCRETSGLNSRVIHSGFHEIPGTLKAELARAGSRLMTQYAEEHGIRLLKCGMLIAIPHGSIRQGLWREAGNLWSLWNQGRHQNISFQFILGARGVRHIAPVRALGAIFIPSVSVVEVEPLVEAMAQDAKAAGAQLNYGTEVTGIRIEGSTYVVRTTAGEFKTRTLINSAGLRAHAVSEMAGGPGYPIEFIRGDYYELTGGIDRWKIRTLVYPATPPHSRSKGIHFGPRTDGRLYIGPSAGPESQPTPKEVFLSAARKFLPEIQSSDLRWAYAGIRPKHRTGTDKSDFTISLDRQNPRLLNLIGIDSPGLSASMGIAQYVWMKFFKT